MSEIVSTAARQAMAGALATAGLSVLLIAAGHAGQANSAAAYHRAVHHAAAYHAAAGHLTQDGDTNWG